MKIYVISLKRAAERRMHIQKHLGSLGLDYEIIDAQDYRQTSSEDFAKLADKAAVSRNPFLTKGVLACAVSHQKAYRKIVSEGVETALVLEDDVALDGNCRKLLDEIKKKMVLAEVITLGYASHTADPLELSTRHRENVSGETALFFPVNVARVSSAMAYIITQEAARRILEKASPICAAADDWGAFYHFGAFTSFRCVYPALAGPVMFDSTIDYPEGKTLRVKLGALIRRYKIPFLLAWLKNRNRHLIKQKFAPRFVDKAPFNQREERGATA